MIEVGQTCELEVVKQVKFGFYLDAHELGDVLLPNKFAPKDLKEGGFIQVFLYLDSEDRPIATTQKPKAEVGDFAFLKAVSTTSVGAFLDWGLDKDVLVPYAEQHKPMVEGQSYLVYLYLDKIDKRITASSKIDRFLDDETPHNYQSGESVAFIITKTTDLGYKVVINHRHWGVLHNSDAPRKMHFGETVKGFIKHIRPDGKIDVSLTTKTQKHDNNTQAVLDYLTRQGGKMALHDGSSPADIKSAVGLSKNAFKRALGSLLKQGLIEIKPNGVVLL